MYEINQVHEVVFDYGQGEYARVDFLQKVKEILFHEFGHLKDPKLEKGLGESAEWAETPAVPETHEEYQKYHSSPIEEDAFVSQLIPMIIDTIKQYPELPYNELAHEVQTSAAYFGWGLQKYEDKIRYDKRMKKIMKMFDTLYDRLRRKASNMKSFSRVGYQVESPSPVNKERMQPRVEPTPPAFGRCLRRALQAIDHNPELRLVMGPPDQLGDSAHFWTIKKDGTVYDPTPEAVSPNYKYEGRIVDVDSVREELGLQGALRGFTRESAPWTDKELDVLKNVYREARDQGIPHNKIYQRLSDYIPHSARGIKQKLEALYRQDEDLAGYKFENWNREKIISELEKLYKSGEPVSRKELPPKLEYQITNHSLPKAITRGFEVFFDSFDHAVAEAILNSGYARNERGELDQTRPFEDLNDAWRYYRRNEKKNNPWTKEEIAHLFQKAHNAGLPLTKSFFTSHLEVYKTLLDVNKSLDGLRKSVNRLGLTWGDLVIEAVPDYESWYNEDGDPLNTMGELRVIRFLDLNDIPYRTTSRKDKIPVTEPEVINAGYKNFVPDIFILDEHGNDIGLVEIYGAIADSGAASGELSQKYREKIEAKERVYNSLPLAYIAIHDNSLYGSDLDDNTLREKFALFMRDPSTSIDEP